MPNYAIQVTYYKDGRRQLTEVARYHNVSEDEVRYFYNNFKEMKAVQPDEAVKIELFDTTDTKCQLDSVIRLGSNASVDWLQDNGKNYIALDSHELSILADSLVRTRGELTRSLRLAYEGSNKKAVIHYHDLLNEINSVRVKVLKAMKGEEAD